MKRILREPLLHFVVLGAALFVAYGVLSGGDAASPGKIVVTAGRIEHLATGFARTWQRPPSDTELKALVDDWVREEIATREAMALGLDQDDTVVRRRLRQKLEFVSEDLAAQVEPTDGELDAYLRAHPDSFRVEPRFTFLQVYFDPARRGDRLAREVAQVLERLQQAGGNVDVAELGDSLLLERSFQSVPKGEIAKQFGDGFAEKLAQLVPGRWQGPVESGYGAHLVFVRERTAGHLPDLAQVRDAVKREWANARRLQDNEKFYEELLARYVVVIEGRESSGAVVEPK